MEDTFSTSPVKRISNPQAAKWLTSAVAVELLKPFMGRSSSVSEAASQLGLTVKDAHYRVRKMLALGILHVVSEEARSGRPIKRYSTGCERFFVPFALTPAATVTERLLQQCRPSFEELGASIVLHMEHDHLASHLGFTLAASEGKVTCSLSLQDADPDWSLCHYWLAPPTPAMYLFSGAYRLERTRAKEVQRRLDELLADIGRYHKEADGSPTANSYRCLLGMAPITTP